VVLIVSPVSPTASVPQTEDAEVFPIFARCMKRIWYKTTKVSEGQSQDIRQWHYVSTKLSVSLSICRRSLATTQGFEIEWSQ
jgi:hypothetical protein